VLIVFDRLFGTWQPELAQDPCRYGLVHQLESHNPLRIVFHEWLAMARDLRGVRTLRQAAGYLFAAPGWRPDGRGQTTAALRAALHQEPRLQAPAPSQGQLVKG
jgi:hypothetical protein